VVLVIAGAVVVIPRWLHTNTGQSTAEREIAIPGAVLLPSLRQKPVPGWRVKLDELIPNTNQRLQAQMFGYLGDNAYFTVSGPGNHPRAWIVGLDVKHGTPLFPPVEILDYMGADCYVNGPHPLLCLNNRGSDDQIEAWVIDSHSGAVVSRGPTDLRVTTQDPSLFTVDSVGDYAVALHYGVGWYGLGDHGERTWFVPGTGEGVVHTVGKQDFPGDPVSNLVADQDGPGLVFSAENGKIFDHVPGWVEPVMGGFVVMDGQSPSAFHFYDNNGNKKGEYRPKDGESAEIAGNGQRAIVTLSKIGSNGAKQLIFTASGQLIAETKTHSLNIRFIGNDMYAAPDDAAFKPNAIWSKYNLTTGNSVSACAGLPVDAVNYVGSDGTVVVGWISGATPSDPVFVAVDTNTCTRQWELPDPQTHTRLWAVGSTLIQSRFDTKEIVSLVPPS